MPGWNLEPAYSELHEDFGSLEAVFALTGERLTRDPLSEVIRVERGGVNYYVKRYVGAGKGLRAYLGKPRVKSEWQNLKRFAKWGIPTAEVIAWGLERNGALYGRGALITRELAGTRDLHHMARQGDPRLRNRAWVQHISQQLAQYTRTLHDHHFTHNDLKWRNLLVDGKDQLYFIDCPNGAFWWGFLLRYRIIKDLACLDKLGKTELSNTQRLRFYLQYRRRERLNAADKLRIGKIVRFFEGRE